MYFSHTYIINVRLVKKAADNNICVIKKWANFKKNTKSCANFYFLVSFDAVFSSSLNHTSDF